MTQDEAKEITLKWLIKLYGKTNALRLFSENESTMFDYQGLAYSLGKESLRYFCEIFLHDLLFDYSGDKVPLSEKHYEIWDYLQDTILNRNNTRDVFILPRGYGKTITINIPLAIWTALYGIHPFVVIQSAIADRAENFISTIKQQLENNEYINQCFGQLVEPGTKNKKRSVINKSLKYNVSEIELDVMPQRTKIQAVSSTSGVRGIQYGSFRPGLLLVDDGQDDKQVTTDKGCADIVFNFRTGIMKTLQTQHNHVIALGTVIRVDDLYDTLLNDITWTRKIEKCIPIDDIDDYFKSNPHWMKVKEILLSRDKKPNALQLAEEYYLKHKKKMDFPVIWDKYKCYDLFLDWLSDNVSFKREYQGEYYSLGEKRIHSMLAIAPEEIEKVEFTKTILSVDPAAVNKKKNDYYAFVILSETENHMKYVRKAIIGKMEYDKYIDMVINLLVQYTDINALSVEKNTYMGADVAKIRERISQHPELKYRELCIFNKQRLKNKDARINAIIPEINMHNIIFNKEDVEANEQIKSFAGATSGVHDDAIDCLADCCEMLPQIKIAGEYYFLPFGKFGIY